jgi:hypothetical protein
MPSNHTETTWETPRILPNGLPNGVPLRFYQKRDSRLVGNLCSQGQIFAGQYAGDWTLTILRPILAQSVLFLSRHPSPPLIWQHLSVLTEQHVLRTAWDEE